MFKLILPMIFTLCIPSEHIVDFNRNVEKSTSFEEILPINKSYNNLDKYKSKTAYAPDNVWYTIDFKDSYFAHGSNIIIPFDFPYLDENQLIGINITYSNGINLYNQEKQFYASEGLEVEFNINDFDQNYIEIVFDIMNEYQDFIIYTTSDQTNDYISLVSYIGCKQQEFKYLYDNSLIGEDEYNSFVYSDSEQVLTNEIDDEVSLDPTKPTKRYRKNSDSSQITVYGKIEWKDTSGNIRPARKMRIDVMDDDVAIDDIICITETEEDGTFSISFDNNDGIIENGYDIYVRVLFRNDYFEVFDSIFIYSYNFTNVYENCENGDKLEFNHVFDLTASDVNERDRAISVFQAITYGFEYLELVDAKFDYLCVQFESWYTGLTSFYDFALNLMHIHSNDQDNWDVILHEFGHFAADRENFTDYWPANHSLNQNQNDEHGKWIGPMLSWSEGFASYFSIIAQEKTSLSIANPAIYNTCNMHIYGENIETSTANMLGEGNESVISRLLWDLQDDGLNENHDKIGIGHKELWQSLRDASSHYLVMQNLTDYLKYYPNFEKSEELGTLLNYYNISASLVDIAKFNRDEILTFSWSDYNGSTDYPNNDFVLRIMKLDGTILLEKNVGDSTSYKPSIQEWQSIMNTGIKCIKWNVLCSQKNVLGNSGPFLSETKIIKIENKTTVNLVASNFDVVFENSNGQGQYFFYEKTENHQSENNISYITKRLRCSYIENQYLVLSANRNNAGIAYLEFDFNSDINKISFDMSLWSSSENIFDTNTTIKVQYKNLEGQWIDSESYLVSTLSKDRNNMNSYEVDFYNDNNSAIRFIVQTLAPVGDRNKGRVVLDNINVYF